jgi:hypothetical protein
MTQTRIEAYERKIHIWGRVDRDRIGHIMKQKIQKEPGV